MRHVHNKECYDTHVVHQQCACLVLLTAPNVYARLTADTPCLRLRSIAYEHSNTCGYYWHFLPSVFNKAVVLEWGRLAARFVSERQHKRLLWQDVCFRCAVKLPGRDCTCTPRTHHSTAS